MNFEEEIVLLIKSRYPLIVVETIDEGYVASQLFSVSVALRFEFYQWSVTRGLRVGNNENSFYQSGESSKMLRLMLDVIKENKPSVIVLSDFSRYLSDAVVSRLFKDLLERIKGTQTTVVMIGSGQKLPEDVSHFAANIVGGYPDEKGIAAELDSISASFKEAGLVVDLPPRARERMSRAMKGLSIQQIRSVVNRCIIKDGRLDCADMAEVERFKKEIFDRDGVLEFFPAEHSSSIAGFMNLKRWVSERKSVKLNPAIDLPPPKGVLLLGVQGCGKSLAAKVIAGEFSYPLYRLDLGRLYSKYIGETEENLRKALGTIARLSPVCLWIDEIEKTFASSSGDMDGGVSKRLLGTFLTWMQERKDQSFIAATANDISSLPAEFLRKGRFDEIFFADLPAAPERAAILSIQLSRRGLKPETFDLNALSSAAEGFSGAELEQAVVSALYSASASGGAIGTPHVLAQIKTTRPLSALKAESVSALRNWAKERGVLPV